MIAAKCHLFSKSKMSPGFRSRNLCQLPKVIEAALRVTRYGECTQPVSSNPRHRSAPTRALEVTARVEILAAGEAECRSQFYHPQPALGRVEPPTREAAR